LKAKVLSNLLLILRWTLLNFDKLSTFLCNLVIANIDDLFSKLPDGILITDALFLQFSHRNAIAQPQQSPFWGAIANQQPCSRHRGAWALRVGAITLTVAHLKTAYCWGISNEVRSHRVHSTTRPCVGTTLYSLFEKAVSIVKASRFE
jgi:hypothetical protein